MNRFKYLSVVLFSAALAGVVFVSCNKDKDPDPAADGKKAGGEMCSCVSKIEMPSNEADYEKYSQDLGLCAGLVVAKNHKYISMNIPKFDEENPDFSNFFEFKDEVFKNAFIEATGNCAKDNIIKK